MSQMQDVARQMRASVQGLSEGLMPALTGPNRKVGALPTLKVGSESEYEWSELARLVLEAEIQDNILNLVNEQRLERTRADAASRGEEFLEPEALQPVAQHLLALANRMGCHIEDLWGVKAGIDPLEWEKRRWERIVKIESVRDKLKSWNELEALAVQALIHRVESNRVNDTNELLAIANTAARVTQVTNSSSGHGGGSNVNVQINQIGVNPQGDLPGPGSLGPITLTLSHRVHGQLKQNREQSDGSYLDSIEMLGVKDVPNLTKTIDGETVK